MSDSKSKVYCSGGRDGVANWILPLGFEKTDDIKEANLIAFAGGEDIDTGFYREPRGHNTNKGGRRDVEEKADFDYGVKNGIKMVGVCRGAQLLCALSGGQLIQHVSNHAGRDHAIATSDRQTLKVNSIHHQMMFPYTLQKEDYKILAWANRPLSTTYLNGYNREKWLPVNFKEAEVAYFTKTGSLAIQFHPEMMYRAESYYGPTNRWLGEIFNKFINNEL